jgi:hypothetical protein
MIGNKFAKAGAATVVLMMATGCGGNSAKVVTAQTSAPSQTTSASAPSTVPTTVTTMPTPAVTVSVPPKVVLPAGVVDPTKLPPADPTIVAAIKTGPNKRFPANYLATIDQAARTHDTAALDHLLNCAGSGKCAVFDQVWSTPGAMDQIPVLLEKAVIGQNSGQVYVPQFNGPAMFAPATDADEKKLLGVAFPSEYRGLDLGFSAGGLTSSGELIITWQSAGLQQAPASTVRLANLTTVTSANMPAADPAILAKVQTTMDSGEPLKLPANLVALVVEAAQDHDIDALLKLCQPCSTDAAYKAKFITEITRSAIPYSQGRFDELARALMTHPALANDNSAGLFYPGYDQTWLKPWSTSNPDGPKPDTDAADKQKYQIGHMDGYVDVKTVFLLMDDGPNPWSAWMGLDGLK